jgi:hypothetical protein
MEMRRGAAKYKILQETKWLSAHKNGGYVLLGMVHFNLSLHHLLPFFHPITPLPPPTRGRAVKRNFVVGGAEGGYKPLQYIL